MASRRIAVSLVLLAASVVVISATQDRVEQVLLRARDSPTLTRLSEYSVAQVVFDAPIDPKVFK